MKDLTNISTDLFNKVRSRFSKIKLGDKAGKVITDPANARFFDLDYTHDGASLGHVNIKIDEKSLTVIYSDSMVEGNNTDARKHWYDFLKELRMFAKSNLLNFDTRDITKNNLDKRDYEYLAQENGEMKMSESKLWGTSKTSYQDVGEAKIIVKHSQPVNYNLPAGRTMHIDSIYIESASGERFRYPHRHLNGARAMAVHIANGGTSYDQIGTHISGLSEELAKLRQFKNYTQRNGLSEALSDVSDKVIERISEIKDEISRLQKQSYYTEFKESYKPYQSLPVPEETINQWVDALTIKTFNEELKNIFPYIYRLVDQPKEVGYEDLIAETKCTDCGCDPCECDEDEVKEHNHLEDFENHLDDISTFEYDMGVVEEPNEGNEFAQKVQMLKAQGAKPGTKFKTSDGQEHTLKDAIEAFGMTLEDFWTEDELAEMQLQQSGNPREVVEFIMSMYDRETGTFPKGEEGVKIAVEKRFGDQAGQFAGNVVERLSVKQQVQPDFNTMQEAIQEAADAASASELTAAIRKFQQAAGIKVDGLFGPETSQALKAAASGAPAPGGANPKTGVNAQGQNVSIKNPDGSTTNPETGQVTPATNTAGSVMPKQATAGNLSAQPAAPAQPGGAVATNKTTTSNTSVSGELRMGKPVGPIQYNGKTVNPGEPDYAAASQALLAQQDKIQQVRQGMRPGGGGAPKLAQTSNAPVQQGAVSRDF